MNITKRTRVLTLLASGSVCLLAGCGSDSLSRSFGLTRDAPDEFTVTTRAPLSMPPDFSLRPPDPGAPRPQERNITKSAEAALAPDAVLAQPTSGNAADSPGQDALLQAAGPRAPADIRSKVDNEAFRDADSSTLADKLIFWKDPKPPGVVVDAQKEAERLRQDSALGQSPDTGVTPVIRQKNRSLFDALF